MERSILTFSPENFVTIAILSGFAYLGVVGAKLLIAKAQAARGA